MTKLSNVFHTLRTKAKRGVHTFHTKKQSPIQTLPQEMLLEIFTHLNHVDLIKASRVNVEWYQVASDEVVWRELCFDNFENSLNKELSVRNVDWENEQWQGYRMSFIQKYKQDRNWKHGICSEMTLYGHTGTIWNLAFDGKRIVSGSFDKTIKVFDIETRKCKTTLRGHNYPIQCLQMQDDILITGSLDNSIRAWDLNGEHNLGPLIDRAHNFDVFCLQFKDKTLVTGSSDSTAKLWQMEWGKCVVNTDQESGEETSIHAPISVQCREVLRVNGCVTCLQFEGDRLITGSANKHAQLWDMNTGQLVSAFQGHSESLRALQFSGNCLITGSNDSTVKVWDLRGKEPTFTLKGHQAGVRCLQFEGSKLVTGSADRTLRVWDLNSRQSSILLEQGANPTCLRFHGDTLAAGFSDNKIKVLSF